MNRRPLFFLISITLLNVLLLGGAWFPVIQAQSTVDSTSGNWTTATPLPQAFGHTPAVVYNGRVYLAGGEGPSGNVRTTVYYATFQPDGTLSAWNTTTPLALPRNYHAMVAANGYLYVIGGLNNSAMIHHAPIQADGTLGDWTPLPTTPLPAALSSPSAVVASGRIYVLGGYNGTANQNTVYYATVNADGTLSNWNTTTPLPQNRSFSGAVVANGRIYTAGGWLGTGWTTATYSAVINADGTLGNWGTLSALPKSLGNHVLLYGNNALYVAGGFDGSTSQKGVYSAPLQANGTLGNWTAMTDLPQPLHDLAGAGYGNLYIFGGFNSTVGAYQNTVYVNQLPFSCDAVTEIPTLECQALVAFYNTTNGANWTNHTGWLATTTPCSWYGVVCRSNYVNALTLPNNQVSGNIPTPIADLANLENLNLSINALTGNIPAQLGKLTGLSWLNLGENQLSGTLPPELGNLQNLLELFLNDNQLSGVIPSQLGNLHNLTTLNLYGNQLSGEIPASVSNSVGLTSLSLGSNQFSGNLPVQLGNLIYLTNLSLNNNQFTGALPGSLINLTKLTTFSFQNTGLCEPPDATFQSWLAGIATLQRTNLKCVSTYAISGQVTDGNIAQSQVTVDAHTEWQNTGIAVQTGDQVQVTYLSGTWTIWKGIDPYTDANGQAKRTDPCTLLPSANTSGLVARIGTGVAQFSGNTSSFTAQGSGTISLSINDCSGQFANNDGTIIVLVTVTPSTVHPIADVTISDDAGHTAHTDASGHYTLPGLAAGTYTVTPSKSGYTFSPASLPVIVPPDAANKNFTGTAQPVNHPPVANDQSVTTTQNTAINITLTASDADGDPLTYSFTNPSHGQLTGTAPNLTYTPESGFSGSDSFTFKVSDGKAESNATVSITISSQIKAWTLMYYFAADNDLAQEKRQSYQYYDLSKVSSNPNVNVVAFFDGVASDAGYTVFSANGGTRFPQGELNTGNPITLEQFVKWSQQNYPATYYALIIADHGSGVSGVAYDGDGKGDCSNFLFPCDPLTPHELPQALSTTRKLDIVYMDACLMGTIESAYQLRYSADYYVASESIRMSPNWASWYITGHEEYGGIENIIIPAITSSTTPEQLAIAMAKSYDGRVEFGFRLPSTISVVKLSNALDVAIKASTLAGFLKLNMTDFHTTLETITHANMLQHFEENLDGEITDADEYVDLYDFAELVESHINDSVIQDYARQLKASISNYVIYERHWNGWYKDSQTGVEHYWDHAKSHGVSIFFPKPNAKRGFYTVDWLDFAAGANWNTLLSSGLAESILPPADTTIEWGPMLVEFVKQTYPNAPDDPNPPALVAPVLVPELVYLPLIVK